jgi:hypothetical protein
MLRTLFTQNDRHHETQVNVLILLKLRNFAISIFTTLI